MGVYLLMLLQLVDPAYAKENGQHQNCKDDAGAAETAFNGQRHHDETDDDGGDSQSYRQRE